MLLRAMAVAGRPVLGLIDAGGEAVVEKRSPLCHGESCLFTGFTTSWSAFCNPAACCFWYSNSLLGSTPSDWLTSGQFISKMSIKASKVFPRKQRRAGRASRVRIKCFRLQIHGEKAPWLTFFSQQARQTARKL